MARRDCLWCLSPHCVTRMALLPPATTGPLASIPGICKEMKIEEGRVWLLLREDSVTSLPPLAHSASGNINNPSVFLVSRVLKFSCFGALMSCLLFLGLLAQACQYSPCVGMMAAASPLLSCSFSLSLGFKALRLLQPQISQVSNAFRCQNAKKAVISNTHRMLSCDLHPLPDALLRKGRGKLVVSFLLLDR